MQYTKDFVDPRRHENDLRVNDDPGVVHEVEAKLICEGNGGILHMICSAKQYGDSEGELGSVELVIKTGIKMALKRRFSKKPSCTII